MATQSFDLQVRPSPNHPPLFVSTPPSVGTVGKGYFYRPAAQDDDDAFTFDLLAGPVGMQIEDGLIEFFPSENELGLHFVSLQATDDRGATSVQNFEIEVLSDSTSPTVTIQFSESVIEPGATVELLVIASDNVAISEIALRQDGTDVQLDDQGRVSITPDTPGLLTFEAYARDTAGNEGSTISVLRVIDPTDHSPPEILIDSPAPGDSIRYLSDVVGTIAADDLELYRVELASAELVDTNNIAVGVFDDSSSAGIWKTLTTSTTSIHEGILAEIDPTTLPNGDYFLRVFAQDFSGNADVKVIPVTVDGPAKLGQFSIDFVDLSIPLAGIPIEVHRNYSTLNATRAGDFGFGWSLGAMDADIRETVAPGTEDQIGVFGQTAFVYGTRVYLTNPDGERIGFTFEPERTGSFFGDAYLPKFTPDPGVTDELHVEPITLSQTDDGSFVAFLVGFPFNPSEYDLVRHDGLIYSYEQSAGLQRIQDANGNHVDFSSDGIQHSSGEAIAFQRNNLGQIASITDPSGIAITYAYDAAGNLSSVTDRAGVTSHFGYLSSPAHFLQEINDPSGRLTQRTEYSDDGRIAATIDALGNRVEQDWNPSDFTGTITNANGHVTQLVYDARGNVLVETDPLGHSTYYEYGDPRHPDLETQIEDRRGYITQMSYDEAGNLLEHRELGHRDASFDAPVVSSFTYNERNQQTSSTDALQNTTLYKYDDFGNLTQTLDAALSATTFAYDAEGRLLAATDPNLNTTTFHYSDGAEPSTIAFADGTFLDIEYNSLGQTTLVESREADGTLAERRESTYDAAGRLVETIFGDGTPGGSLIARWYYSGSLLDYQVLVDPESLNASGELLESPETPVAERKSRITDFEYDAAGRLIRRTDATGAVTEFRYDAAGNQILLMDPVGNITTWLYDPLGRIQETRDPFFNAGLSINDALAALQQPSGADCETAAGAQHVSLACFDQEGHQVTSIDRNGRRTEFAFDGVGRPIAEVWFDASSEPIRTISFGYDIAGRLLNASDEDSQYSFAYDSRGNLLTEDSTFTAPDSSGRETRVILTHEYDAAGNRTQTSDNNGVVVASTFDALGRLASRNWFGDALDSSRVEFEYNAVDEATSVYRFADLAGNDLVGHTQRTYDLAGRVQNLTHFDAVDEILADYAYDYNAFSEVSKETRSDSTLDYAYDLAGQLLEVLQDNASVESYAYDANGNRMDSEYIVGPNNQTLSDERYDYVYDGEGNMIQRTERETGVVSHFTYDHRNRLIEIEVRGADGTLIHRLGFTYDTLNRRIVQIVDGETTTTVYDEENAWADYDGEGEVATQYLFGTGMDENLARQHAGDGTDWYLVDRLGSVQDVIDNNAVSIAQIDYSAFGAVSQASSLENADRYLYAGRELMPQVGLYFNRARIMDPVGGRFVSQDPLGFTAGDTNLYRYVGNSPTNATDPTGEITTFQVVLLHFIAAEVGAAIGVVIVTAILIPFGFLVDYIQDQREQIRRRDEIIEQLCEQTQSCRHR
ncbi:MAG: RHS repeat-associated core domain-containing protein [Planctomycetota bacterium]